MSVCPDPERLERLAADPSSDPALRRHVDRCAACRALLESIAADDALIVELAAAEAERSAVERAIASDGGAEEGGDASGTTGAACNRLDVHVVGAAAPTVPGFDVLREIHRGGQGVVYEAIQHSTRRRVALKLLLRGRLSTPRQRRRFEREIEAVAALRHPGIVTLYEGGRTPGGEAYFAMELVDGTTLDLAWRGRRLRGEAGPDAVLAIFADVCRAVAHAHQKGVIHCDLKPSNILVDGDGSPRLLDFGIARMEGTDLAPDTSDAAFTGTFAYAAPEQLVGQEEALDVRVDVYALGVILHELLLGEPPFAECTSVAALVRRKCAATPPIPDSARRAAGLDRDAAIIVQRATAVEPSRRYQSAAELLDDVERRLARRPITARQDSVLYVLAKAAQRHRRLVATAAVAACALLTLAALLAVTLLRHERERRDALDTLHTFRETLAATDPLDVGRGPASLVAFLDDVRQHVDRHLADQPDSAAAIHGSLGQIALSAAEYGVAERHLREALRLAEEARDEVLRAECLHHLGRAEFFRGSWQEAARLYREALTLRRALLGAGHADVATTTSHLASCLRRLGDLDESERLLRQALEIRLAQPDRPEDIAAAWNNLGSLMHERGAIEDALDMFERALAIVRRSGQPADWRVAHALRNRATCLIDQRRFDEASADLEESYGIWRRLVDEDHPALAGVQHQQARAALGDGRIADARQFAEAALKSRRERMGDLHPDTADSMHLLGAVAAREGRLDLAAASFGEALALRRQLLPAGHRLISESATSLAEVLANQGDHAAAAALLLECAAPPHQQGSRQADQPADQPVGRGRGSPHGAPRLPSADSQKSSNIRRPSSPLAALPLLNVFLEYAVVAAPCHRRRCLAGMLLDF